MRDQRLYRVLCLLGCVVALWSAMPAGTAQAQEGTVQYVVKQGDTLYSIAKAHGVTVEQLQAWNTIADPRQLKVGQTLVINPPAGGEPIRAQAATPTATQAVSTQVAASPPLLTTLTAFGVIFLLLIAILSLLDRRRS